VARVALVWACYLILAESLLGQGALYGIAREVAFAGALVLGWRLISDWRDEVTQAYLKLFPQGRLADSVRASQGRAHGLLIAAAAFLFVASRGLWVWLRDTALRFEQTRKALAYLFRRQLERQSRKLPAPPDPALLPAELQAALTEDAVDDGRRIDVFPALDSTVALARQLAGGGDGGLLALSGERGAGKTSWLLALQAQLAGSADFTLPCRMHTFEERQPGVPAVCRALSGALGLPALDEPEALIQAVLAQPPQAVLLDLTHNVMLRTVGGLDAHQALIRVAQATVGRVLWVLTYGHWPFEYLQRTLPGRDIYDRVIALRPWSEQQISALIDARMEVAGFEADYEHLLLNAAPPRHLGTDLPGQGEEAERSADRYHRLVWDYANGNPRIALHFFRLSLEWTHGKQVRVRLFALPSVDVLEEFESRTWFTLACLVQHENITVPEAAESLRFPAHECERALELLHRRGFLTRTAAGRYRVASHWARAVQRFLQRKKLLVV
jgi:hypothetical protein